jgi:hypothetical protein
MGHVSGPRPTRVWLYRPEGGPEASAGVLSLDGSAVVFSGAETEALRIAVADVRSVRRHRLTPVLEVRYGRGGGDPGGVALFYFAEPPPLPEPGEKADRGPQEILLPSRRHLERSGTLLSMRAASKLLKRDIDQWVEAIREAGGARG